MWQISHPKLRQLATKFPRDKNSVQSHTLNIKLHTECKIKHFGLLISFALLWINFFLFIFLIAFFTPARKYYTYVVGGVGDTYQVCCDLHTLYTPVCTVCTKSIYIFVHVLTSNYVYNVCTRTLQLPVPQSNTLVSVGNCAIAFVLADIWHCIGLS